LLKVLQQHYFFNPAGKNKVFKHTQNTWQRHFFVCLMSLLDGEGGEGCYASWKFLGSDWRYSMEKRDLLIHFGWPLRSKEEVTKIQWFGKRFPDSRAKYNTLFTFGWRPVPVTVSLPREIDVAAKEMLHDTLYWVAWLEFERMLSSWEMWLGTHTSV
jgi:hypothetical protein